MNHVDLLHRGIAAAVQRFHRNRFDFLSERDLQALLFGILVAEFGSETIPMKGGYHSAEAYGGTDTIQTIPVKCEYSISQRTSEKFDLAILDSEAVRHYDPDEWRRREFKSDAFWNQPVRAAVEIKYLQLGVSLRRGAAWVQQDVEKLRPCLEDRRDRPFLGISLLFIQSAAPVPSAFFTGSEISEDPQDGLATYVVTPALWRKFSA